MLKQDAIYRAGGKAGNKGHEAMGAALELADVLRQLRERPMIRRETRCRARALQMLYAWEAPGYRAC